MENARLEDIAGEAGVSKATVSRVLNDRPGVSAAKRQAVLSALDALGYEPPQRLVPRRHTLVGLVTSQLDSPTFLAFAQALEVSLASYGRLPILSSQPPGPAEDDVLEQLLDSGARGILYVCGPADTAASAERFRHLAGRGVPLVILNGHYADVGVPVLSTDDRLASQLVVSHLTGLGHRRIGLMTGQRRSLAATRQAEGFRAAAAGLPGEGGDELIERTLPSVEGGQAAGAALLDRGCTALVCGTDLMALGAIRALRGRGLRVPEDVSVVGYDDSPFMAFTDPPLTILRRPVAAMAAAAADTLVEMMQSGTVQRLDLSFRPELIVRGSTAAAP